MSFNLAEILKFLEILMFFLQLIYLDVMSKLGEFKSENIGSKRSVYEV